MEMKQCPNSKKKFAKDKEVHNSPAGFSGYWMGLFIPHGWEGINGNGKRKQEKLDSIDISTAFLPYSADSPIKIPPEHLIISWPWEEVAQLALRDYNKKHGTDLEFVRVLDDKVWDTFLAGTGVKFTIMRSLWKHINFEARQQNVGPHDKVQKLVLFSESYSSNDELHHTKVSLVDPTYHGGEYCSRCEFHVCCPNPGFRAGFYPLKRSCETIILSEQDATEFAEFAIQDYNEKHGTNLKLEMALECNKFEGLGVLMDFTKKKRTWVHMNLVARVGPKEELLVFFAEFYLSDDEYVLATLALVNTWDPQPVSKKDGLWCRFCLDGILHPMEGCFFNFYPPHASVENLLEKGHGN
ncbi:mercaptopyruvate sulfurtransferase 1 [Striga asiatica]|uniref:Mercaptopyruvate sulfurtransferase 1 n=1 Tax=Striga asiatica TaxID=4170 RepID=A0A5A7P2L5_STRAF|nr:mercaptopyruvate sulfurtransferase 1 [Striga asiatica]